MSTLATWVYPLVEVQSDLVNMSLAKNLAQDLAKNSRSEIFTVARARDASRLNGALSHGPKSEEGKAISARNAIHDGFSAQCVLMRGESLEERRELMDQWAATFKPATPGEAHLVSRIVDVFARKERLEQFEARALEEAIESEVSKTAVAKKVDGLNSALQVAQELSRTAESIQAEVPWAAVQQLAPAIRRSVELVEAAEVPLKLVVPFRDAVNAVLVDSVLGGVQPAVFHAVAVSLQDIETWLLVAKNIQQAGLEEERHRLAGDPTLLDDGQLKKIDRHRARLAREMEGHLRLLRQVRDLARPGDDGLGSFVVELRVVEKPCLAKR